MNFTFRFFLIRNFGEGFKKPIKNFQITLSHLWSQKIVNDPNT